MRSFQASVAIVSKQPVEPFTCPNCGARYKLVRAEFGTSGGLTGKGLYAKAAARHSLDVKAISSSNISSSVAREGKQKGRAGDSWVRPEPRSRGKTFLGHPRSKATEARSMPTISAIRSGPTPASLVPTPSLYELSHRVARPLRVRHVFPRRAVCPDRIAALTDVLRSRGYRLQELAHRPQFLIRT